MNGPGYLNRIVERSIQYHHDSGAGHTSSLNELHIQGEYDNETAEIAQRRQQEIVDVVYSINELAVNGGDVSPLDDGLVPDGWLPRRAPPTRGPQL